MYEPRRTHPFGIVDSFVKNIRMVINAMLPTIIILMGNDMGRRYLPPAAGAILLLYVIYSIAWWYRYVYYIAEDELRLEYGLIARKKRYIPLERIQNVQLTENVPQRLLGLTGVKVETAGSSVKAEADLYSIRREQAEELRRLLQAGASAAAPELQENAPVWPEFCLSGRDLLIAAVSSSRVLFIFSGMAALLSQIDQFFPDRDVFGLMEDYIYSMVHLGGLIIVLLVLAVLLVAWLLAFISEIMRWAHFKLIVEDDRLLISRGLLTRRQMTLPRRRIQAVQVVENLIHQPLHLAKIKVITAGGSSGSNETSVLYPIVRRAELAAFLQATVPELAVDDLTVTPVSRWAAPRYFAVLLLPLALVLASFCVLIHNWYAMAALLGGGWLAYRQFKDAGWRLADNRLLLRRRGVALITTLLVRRRIQSLDCSQSFLQKRRALGNIKAAVASGVSGARIKLAGIETSSSDRLQDWYQGRPPAQK